MISLTLYRALTAASAPALRLYLGARVDKGKEDPSRMGERYGIPSVPRPQGPLVWIHAASVGEALSMLCVVERLQAERPSLAILFTTGTVSSARILQERLPSGVIHQFVPVDRAAWVGRFLDHWRPDLALWVESELWPNLLTETRGRGVPLVLMNARMSARSFRGWRRFRTVGRRLLGCFDLCMAQSDEVAAKLRVLGANNVICPGNLKYAAAPLPSDAVEQARLRDAIGTRPRWLAASTHPGEDEAVVATHRALAADRPDLLTVVVPRHAGRGPEIAETLRQSGIRTALRSRGETIADDTGVYVADSMGEMGLFLRLCDIVFVGGTLIPHGGQNPLEPARLGCAVLFGPSMENFTAIMDELLAAGGAWAISDAGDLTAKLRTLMATPAVRERLSVAARTVAESKSEILDAVFDALRPYLDAVCNTTATELRDARA